MDPEFSNILISNNDEFKDIQLDKEKNKIDIKDKVINALDMLKMEGTKSEMIDIANKYADAVGMNSLNRNLLISLKTESKEEFIKKAFTDPYDNTKTLSYSEMRSLYG